MNSPALVVPSRPLVASHPVAAQPERRILWNRMRRLIDRWLPPPRICHPYSLRRLGVITCGKRAGNPLLRICGGGYGQATARLARSGGSEVSRLREAVTITDQQLGLLSTRLEAEDLPAVVERFVCDDRWCQRPTVQVGTCPAR